MGLKVEDTMDDKQARRKLQSAIDVIAEIHERLGSMTVLELEADKTASSVWASLKNAARLNHFQSVSAYLTDLARDEIPF